MPTKKPEIIPAITMPSADLINFRFDQADKRFDELKVGIEGLTNNFVTKEEAQLLLHQRDDKFRVIQRQLDTYRWYLRAVASAALLAAFTTVASLVASK